ncbi:hypothetical protein A3A93_05075 [Candidatus Roizmanbacteria bacterium RIFCSPLOWO2_01_FULL_38_12]|uniref:Aspartate kinase n=1 Tax=Candidatus Roizmanbacteria bacterium RIFCSPLOWO2_01_FULL_38_12 TaxID=1802061 RepID=A0A1F7IQX5_9BACT|nr:MAG: hypothetical protein A2861_02570 [Candidatus Roizmanbacteria bacterium RIFCSPHIGHO2_01_FULL_38_15]OGK34292.1 MAG: hypothetical protein A3F59_05710 [Candidatus Roizmanbacteria bacterium RIFCSPHIGHO2_12_FULL_38_13]OGK45764.1 MAG: hypothetical protein A3A93_05075 [Candidatus Roizmanbacteria bacterium RIFCSPLOWO2_01_FULL_38_12]
MITVPSAVADILNETPYIEELLSRNIINLSSLARDIRPKVEKLTMKDVQIGSIIMALKRQTENLNVKKKFEKVFKISPDLIVRSNLFEITFVNSDTQTKKHRELLEYANVDQSTFLTVTHGIFETTIIANAKLKDKILQLYKDEKIVAILENVSSITVNFPKDIIDIPGVYYILLKVLAWEGIDIAEIVSTYSECTVILKNTYVDRAFSLIKSLFSAV